MDSFRSQEHTGTKLEKKTEYSPEVVALNRGELNFTMMRL